GHVRPRYPDERYPYGHGQLPAGAGLANRSLHGRGRDVVFRRPLSGPGRELVYLDASHDFAGIDSVLSANPAWPPDFKPPGGSHTDTLNAARDWSKRYRFGYWSDALESGILRTRDSDPASERCLLREAILHPKEYSVIRAPALALTARNTM